MVLLILLDADGKSLRKDYKHEHRVVMVGRDRSVGIATRYGLRGTGIESLWEQDFPQPSRPALGPT